MKSVSQGIRLKQFEEFSLTEAIWLIYSFSSLHRMALSLSPKAPEAADPDGIEHHSAKFGLHWFVPELMKHRRIWRDVLVGSLVLQLMGLGLPLFGGVRAACCIGWLL